MDSDCFLIKRMRQGDDAAIDLFVHKYYMDILKYCTYHCFDRETAKDLTQETFLRFFSGFDDYLHQGKAKNYLYTIAKNLCINDYRQPRHQSLDSVGDRVFPIGSDDTLSTQLTIRMYLNRLPEELREVIILYYYQQLKQTEIADVLGIGLPLVKYRLRKAKEHLERLLKTEETHGY